MASTWPTAINSSSASRLVLILPVSGQKVKCVSPSPFEELIGSREQEPARTTDRLAITASFRHNLDTGLQELQTRLVVPDVDHFGLGLTANCNRHDIQASGHHLSVMVAAIPG